MNFDKVKFIISHIRPDLCVIMMHIIKNSKKPILRCQRTKFVHLVKLTNVEKGKVN